MKKHLKNKGFAVKYRDEFVKCKYSKLDETKYELCRYQTN